MTGPVAYFSSVAVSFTTDHRFRSGDFFRDGLSQEVNSAWSSMHASIVSASTDNERPINLQHFNCLAGENPNAIWTPNFVSLLSKTKHPEIQKKITGLIMGISQSKSIADSLLVLTSDDAFPPRVREAVTNIITQLRSETSRVFQLSYANPLNRLDPDFFVCGVRAFFCLPPIISDTHNVAFCAETGCRLQLCTPCLDAGRPSEDCMISPDGSHSQSSKCYASRPGYASHQGMLHALARFLKDFDFNAKCDPSTRKLLLDKFDDVTCSYLFPKAVSGRPLEIIREIRAASARANKSLDAKSKQLILDRVLNLKNKFGHSVTGRKVDLVVDSQLGTKPKLIGDLTIRHPTAPSNIRQSKAFCIKVAKDELAKRCSAESLQPMDYATSPLLTNAEKDKFRSHEVLMKMVRYEHFVAKMPKPVFFPLALSSFGEWSPSLFKFLKECSSQYHAHASALARVNFFTDDFSLPDRKSRFVGGLKDVFACQTIAALGRLMLTAGRPVSVAA